MTLALHAPAQIAFPADDAIAAPIADLLDALGAELRALEIDTTRMQAIFAPALRDKPDPQSIRDAQMVDAVTQRLNGLHLYASALARLVPRHWQIDPRPATQGITIAQLRQHLNLDLPHPPCQEAGDCDLF